VEPSNEAKKNGAQLERAPRVGVRLMIVILACLALVAIYANIQKARRSKIEQVIITPVSTATPPASASAGR
jgi:cell division septal protein FtsQ